MQREFALVIYKNGEKFVPDFPVTLTEEDQLIIVRELRGSQVPKGKIWTVRGYADSGPIISESDV